mgnify:CR=1 FL=1
MKNIILNPIYGIRNDETCSFIYVIDDSFETLIKKLPDALETGNKCIWMRIPESSGQTGKCRIFMCC